MTSLENQSAINLLPSDGPEDVDGKFHSQSLTDVASYPFPMRPEEGRETPEIWLQRQVDRWENEGGRSGIY